MKFKNILWKRCKQIKAVFFFKLWIMRKNSNIMWYYKYYYYYKSQDYLELIFGYYQEISLAKYMEYLKMNIRWS